MAAEISVGAFLDLLRQSGLVADNQMLSLMAEFSGEGVKPYTAREVTDELVKREILTEWQADNLMQGKHRGFFLGPHRILRQLGQGGMSKVFLAEHEMMRRRCAIKILPSKHQSDPELLSRFRLEARAIAALDHPHIVRAYDFNKDVTYGRDIDYLVMEYVEGQDLRRMVEEQGPLDYRKAADYISQAAEGLAHAHAAGLVHRDVKPANLLVDPNGVLKILDLGLARVTLESEEVWQNAEGEQSAVGTADYVAPEQVMDSRHADGRADIYSLGYTFYYLLTGRRPFPKATLPELLMAHRVENPEPIAKLRPDVPIELVEIIAQMTAKTPELRFQTAQEVADRLQTWLHDSASSREYSRISALMAAAMRAKQTGPEDAADKPESAKQAELELTFLDDDAKAPPPAPAPSHRPAPLKAPESKEKSPRKPGPGDSGKTPVLSKTQADLLMDLVADQRGPSVAPLPQFKQRGSTGGLLTSPWLWVSLVGVVSLVVIVLAILLSSPRQPEEPPQQPSEKKTETPAETATSPQPDAPKPQSPTPLADAHKPPPSSVNETPSTPPDKQPSSSPPVEKPPTSPATPPVQPETESAKKPPEANPPTKKESPKVDKVKLLADLTTIAFKYTPSGGESDSQLNMLIVRQTNDRSKSIGLKPDEKSTNVMSIEVKTASQSDSPNTVMVISAQLVCRDPQGKAVTVWKDSKQATYARRSRPDQAFKVQRPAVLNLFQQFVREVQKARSQANP
jgi:serine/threonine protein kinase